MWPGLPRNVVAESKGKYKERNRETERGNQEEVLLSFMTQP